MNTAVHPTLRRSPYSATDMAKPVHFYCAAPNAQAVSLIGDFNGWDPRADPMERKVDGWWILDVPLTHGHHRYQFVVDGKPVLDPHAAGVVHDESIGAVSLIAVS